MSDEASGALRKYFTLPPQEAIHPIRDADPISRFHYSPSTRIIQNPPTVASPNSQQSLKSSRDALHP
jgi:hypothetical protein